MRRIYGLLTGRKYVGTDSIGNMYFERQHPKYPSRVLRELVPPAGQDPADYDPSSVSGEWAHWLQGGGENDHSAHPAGWAQSGQPLDKVVIQDSEEDGPSGPLSRPGTGLLRHPRRMETPSSRRDGHPAAGRRNQWLGRMQRRPQRTPSLDQAQACLRSQGRAEITSPRGGAQARDA